MTTVSGTNETTIPSKTQTFFLFHDGRPAKRYATQAMRIGEARNRIVFIADLLVEPRRGRAASAQTDVKPRLRFASGKFLRKFNRFFLGPYSNAGTLAAGRGG